MPQILLLGVCSDLKCDGGAILVPRVKTSRVSLQIPGSITQQPQSYTAPRTLTDLPQFHEPVDYIHVASYRHGHRSSVNRCVSLKNLSVSRAARVPCATILPGTRTTKHCPAPSTSATDCICLFRDEDLTTEK